MSHSFSVNNFLNFSELDFDQDERIPDLTRHLGIAKKNMLSQDNQGIYKDVDLHLQLDKEEFSKAIRNYLDKDGIFVKFSDHMKIYQLKKYKCQSNYDKYGCLCEICSN